MSEPAHDISILANNSERQNVCSSKSTVNENTKLAYDILYLESCLTRKKNRIFGSQKYDLYVHRPQEKDNTWKGAQVKHTQLKR